MLSSLRVTRNLIAPAALARVRLNATQATQREVPKFPFSRPKDTEIPKEYYELLEKCPVSKVKMWDNTEPWLVVTHKDVCSVLSDTRLSKIRTRPGFPEMGPGGKEAAKQRPTFVDMDPPEHTKQRGMIEPYMTPEAVEKLRPHIQKIVDEEIDAMVKKGAPQNLLEFAMNVPMLVISDMLGIPREDVPKIINYSGVRSSGSSTAAQASMASQELNNYLANLVKEKKKNPGKDIISDLIVNQLNKGHLEEQDVSAIAFLMLVAGNATVCTTIGVGLVALEQHPEQKAALLKDPKLYKSFVNEVCRYYTASAYATRRVAKEDIVLNGVKIAAGDGIIAANQAANRDKTVFRDPDTFDLHRSPNPHVGFGYGIHVCVAEWLARAEMEIAFERLFTRLPNLRIAVPLDQLKYSEPDKDIGLAELPVTW